MATFLRYDGCDPASLAYKKIEGRTQQGGLPWVLEVAEGFVCAGEQEKQEDLEARGTRGVGRPQLVASASGH